MRELLVIINCDRCADEISEEKAELITLSTSQGDYEMDVCPPCREGLVTPLRPASLNKRKVTLGEQLPCPHCEREFGSQRGLTKHIQSAHSRPHPLEQA